MKNHFVAALACAGLLSFGGAALAADGGCFKNTTASLDTPPAPTMPAPADAQPGTAG